nr:MAG TPA: hypothetical protein [Caudoviricetes sp.]
MEPRGSVPRYTEVASAAIFYAHFEEVTPCAS